MRQSRSRGTDTAVDLKEQNAGHTKFGGVLPNYEILAVVRTTSRRPLKMLTVTVMLRRVDNSQVGTQAREADVQNLNPGETRTVKMVTGETLDEIEYHDSRFAAGFPYEKNIEFTVDQSRQAVPRGTYEPAVDLTMATIPVRIASGRSGQASMTVRRAGSIVANAPDSAPPSAN
jgi:hypothetical protein